MRSRSVAVAFLALSCAACGGSCEDPVNDAGSQPCEAPLLRDDAGGVLVLRGANLSADAKWSHNRLPPYEPSDLARLRDELGLDALRLLVFWEAIEPYPGIYDDDYLQNVRTIVRSAADAQLYVVVDMHQDVYGRGFGHAGAPRWSCDESLYATYEAPETWFLGYIEPEVMRCFDRLYEEGPTRSAFVAAWTRLAEEMKDEPNVLAYDLINEPFWGSATASRLERSLLPGFYRDLIDAIRVVDPYRTIGIEPAPTASVGVPTELAGIGRSDLMYMPHFYPPEVEVSRNYTGNLASLFGQKSTLCGDAKRMSMPMALGEAGARRDVRGVKRYLSDLYDMLDSAGVNAFYWDLSRGNFDSYGLWTSSGEPALQARLIARPYPRRIAGKPGPWQWSARDGVFTAEWNEDGTAEGDTTVALPSLAFPYGADVEVSPPGTFEIEHAMVSVAQLGGARKLVVTRRGPRPAKPIAGTLP